MEDEGLSSERLMDNAMKKILIGLGLVCLGFVFWWSYDRYIVNLSPSDEIRRMVSAARLGDETGFVKGFTPESGPIISAMLSLSKSYGHVRVNPIKRIAEAELVDETINGDEAVVLLQYRNKTKELPMKWTDDGWKVDAFEMDQNWKR